MRNAAPALAFDRHLKVNADGLAGSPLTLPAKGNLQGSGTDSFGAVETAGRCTLFGEIVHSMLLFWKVQPSFGTNIQKASAGLLVDCDRGKTAIF